MRINCHAHTFNLQAVFTPETVNILLKRILGWDYPDWMLKAIGKEVEKVITSGGEYTDPDRIGREILGAIIQQDQYLELLEKVSPTDKVKLSGITVEGLETLASKGLGSLINTIGKAIARTNNDARHQNLVDLFEFVLIGMQPSIRRVTDIVMPQLGTGPRGDALVALTLDITKGGEDDQALWREQLQDTSRTVLSYPGRILPFVCVNTRRKDHFEIMERALVSQGFVGVKLYPSLGYQVNSAEMEKVYAYCQERGVPLLMHCNQGGFYRTKPEIQNGDPELWGPILSKFPDLKICFGHFGGGENFITGTIAESSWSGRILKLMADHPNVYADISFHTAPMDGGQPERNYFGNLKELIASPVSRHRVLFGTDFFLVRQRLKEKSSWEYFEDHLTKAEFRRIAEANPRKYLGLPVGNKKVSWAIGNYVRFLWQNKGSIDLESPAVWLEPVVRDLFGEKAKLPRPDLSRRWNAANRFHAHTYIALKNQLSGQPRFARHDRTRLVKLHYWRKGLEEPGTWADRVQNMSHMFDAHFLANGFAHKKDWNALKAVQAFAKKFNDPSTALWELAALTEKIYNSTKDGEVE